MAAVAPVSQPLIQDSFVDRHFAKLAFAISIVALLIFSPLALILGTIAGFALDTYLDPNLRPDRIITIPNASFTIVGAVAAILRWTPAGRMGSPIFRSIPYLGALGISF